MTGCSEECSFGVTYFEWYVVCDFDVFSVVETCVDCGGVYVFLVDFDFFVFMVLVLVFMLMYVLCSLCC